MSWHLDGTYFEACNCDVACPCIFLSAPTEGECTVLVAWHIDRGRDGEVSLDGLNAAMAVHAPGHMLQTKWRAALYLDERASEPQQQSLTKIFGGQAGGHPAVLAQFVDDILGVTSTAIDYRAAGKDRSLTIPNVASIEIEALAGQNGDEVTVSGHPLCIAPGHPATVAKSSQVSYTDHGMTWTISGKNGLFSPFTYPGD